MQAEARKAEEDEEQLHDEWRIADQLHIRHYHRAGPFGPPARCSSTADAEHESERGRGRGQAECDPDAVQEQTEVLSQYAEIELLPHERLRSRLEAAASAI